MYDGLPFFGRRVYCLIIIFHIFMLFGEFRYLMNLMTSLEKKIEIDKQRYRNIIKIEEIQNSQSYFYLRMKFFSSLGFKCNFDELSCDLDE